MTTQDNHISVDENMRKVALNKRLEDSGWGVLLIAIGTLWLVPDKHVPPGSWLIAAGLIMMGLNAIRYFYGITLSGFSLVVGILALLAGVGEFFGLNLPLLAIALILFGVGGLLKALLEPDSVAPTGDSWCCCADGEPPSNQDPAQGRAVGR